MANGVPVGVTKAYLEIVEQKGSGGGLGGGKRVDFHFNPKEFELAKKANWKSKPTRGSGAAPPPEYVGPDPASMTLEMLLDASEKDGGDVSKDVQAIVDACIPTDASDSKQKPIPPMVKFGWDKVYFKGYLESISAKFTLFRSDGTPVRALCTLMLKELPQSAAKQNPTSGGVVAQTSCVVVDGESLPTIAYREYGDPNLWRVIADANGIEDPLALRPGSTLLVPLLPDS